MSNKIFPYEAESDLEENPYRTCLPDVCANRGPCDQSPVSDSGKTWQLVKMIVLVTTPVLVLLGLTTFFLNESIGKRNQLAEQKDKIFTGRDLGELIHVLQKERDQTALYLSAIGPDTKIYLIDRYAETNRALSELTVWPVNLARDRKEHFKDKDSFSIFMAAHRNALDLLNPSVYDEILFYNDQIEVLITWMYDAIKLSRFSDIWKLLVTYKKVVRSKEDAGVERALGSSYFANGGFESNYFFLWYLRQVNTFAYEYRTAELFSEDIRQMSSGIINQGENNLFTFVWFYRSMLSKNVNTNISVTQAQYYYDNMTLLIDQLFIIQKKVELDLTTVLNSKEAESLKNIIVASVLMAVIISSFPLQVLSLYSQSGDIQNYAIVLEDKKRELKEEKCKSENLLYQTLPKVLAGQLKNKRAVNGEYFTQATILFIGICDFPSLTKRYTPEQLIGLLQEIYTLIDLRTEYFDVYKVASFADQSMIVSGIPQKNGTKHATEIANLALDLLWHFKHMRCKSIAGYAPIRMGIHSGPVMTCVLGLKLPKYSLFGDTVNTAVNLEVSGEGGKIHISSNTSILLRNSDLQQRVYLFEKCQVVNIMAKGPMTTYWLHGYANNHSLNAGGSWAELDYIDLHQSDRLIASKGVRVHTINLYNPWPPLFDYFWQAYYQLFKSEDGDECVCTIVSSLNYSTKPLTTANISLSKLDQVSQETMISQKMAIYMKRSKDMYGDINNDKKSRLTSKTREDTVNEQIVKLENVSNTKMPAKQISSEVSGEPKDRFYTDEVSDFENGNFNQKTENVKLNGMKNDKYNMYNSGSMRKKNSKDKENEDTGPNLKSVEQVGTSEAAGSTMLSEKDEKHCNNEIQIFSPINMGADDTESGKYTCDESLGESINVSLNDSRNDEDLQCTRAEEERINENNINITSNESDGITRSSNSVLEYYQLLGTSSTKGSMDA